eukprot:g23237.t1
MSSASSSQPGGKDPPKLAERFLLLDDVVAKDHVSVQELGDLDYPWNLKAIEDRIAEYSSVSEAINLQLSARVMQNYNDFVTGMQMVQSVETELSLIGVLIKNGRRKLQIHDQGILRGSMRITRQHQRRERLKELLSLLEDLQGVVEIDARLRESIDEDRYAEAILQHSVLRDALASAQYRRFPGVVGLHQSMANNLTLVQQKLSERLRACTVSADFDPDSYEEVLKAYSLLASDQAVSVGKELLRHVSEFIVAVSRQCMLAFSARNESPDWHKRAQLRELCKSMDASQVVPCILQLYEHLCNFLYRHQFLCMWHLIRSQDVEAEEAQQPAFRELLRSVHTELTSSDLAEDGRRMERLQNGRPWEAGKRNVWQGLQQQVSLVLMTLDFQYPALSEESFMQILHLTQLLMDEGDSFMAGADRPSAARLGVPSTCAAGSLGEDLCSCASILAMSIVIDYFPVQLSLPKKVIIRNRRLNIVYYLAHIPIAIYAVVFFFLNMAYTDEIPNNPFTLIILNPVDGTPFIGYQLQNDPAEQVRNYCNDGDAGTYVANCSDPADDELCQTMFGSLLDSPFEIFVNFHCSYMCEKARDEKCFLPPLALITKGSQEVDFIIGETSASTGRSAETGRRETDSAGDGMGDGQAGDGMGDGQAGDGDGSSGQPPTGSQDMNAVLSRPLEHRTNPMIRDAILSFKYSFALAQPAPYLLGLEQDGARQTNHHAMTVLVDSQDIVLKQWQPGEIINVTVSEIVEAAGAVWNFTMISQGSEFIVTTNCFTASQDLPPTLYWANVPQTIPRDDQPLCLIRFTWLQDQSVTYNAGFTRSVHIRVLAQQGSSFSRLPSIQLTLLMLVAGRQHLHVLGSDVLAKNLVSLMVLMGIPPAFAGFVARIMLGSLSKIYRQATQEYFDLPMQLATAGLKAIANVATFGSLASSTLTKEELRNCLKEVLFTSRQHLADKDLDRLTNFVFEKDPRYPNGPRRSADANPRKSLWNNEEESGVGDILFYVHKER